MPEHGKMPILSIGIWKNCIYFGGFRKPGILSDTVALYFKDGIRQSSNPTDTGTGLNVNGEGMYYCEFTKSLLFRDFDDVWKILLDGCIFSITYIIIKRILKSPSINCNRKSKVAVLHPPPIERGSGPYKSRFSTNQFYLSETLDTWWVSRNRW